MSVGAVGVARKKGTGTIHSAGGTDTLFTARRAKKPRDQFIPLESIGDEW